jgi:hypothetical protein
VPFRFNTAQRRYYDDVVVAGVARDIVAKARKWGFSTQRLGLQLHGVLYADGRIGRTVVQRWDTTRFLGEIVKTLYHTAWKFFEDIGEDPTYFLPTDTSNDVRIVNLGRGKGKLYIETAGGQGVGQADRTDDAYFTEYADWEHPTKAFDGLVGSMPLGAPDNRLTVDYNANETWMSSDAYIIWEHAHKPHDDEDWNGFTAFFAGVLDVPERYAPEELEAKRKEMRERYPLSYPETVEDLYKQRDRCVFNLEHLRKRTGEDYVPTCGRFLHGVDTATGMPDGDWQTCVTLGWNGTAWVEACEPIRRRMPEDAFANLCDTRVRQFPGTCVVEANVGGAVLVRLRELATPGLYHHMHRDRDGTQRPKLGFQTTYASKRVMITDMQRHLAEGTVGLVTPELIKELREFEWKVDVDGKEARGLAGAPDRRGAHDDLAMAFMLALQGASQPIVGAV